MIFNNPRSIEPIPYDWDWELVDAIVHAKGAGLPVIEPQRLQWAFPNGLGVEATTSRAMLLAQFEVFNVHCTLRGVGLSNEAILQLGFPIELRPVQELDKDALERYLVKVKGAILPQGVKKP